MGLFTIFGVYLQSAGLFTIFGVYLQSAGLFTICGFCLQSADFVNNLWVYLEYAGCFNDY